MLGTNDTQPNLRAVDLEAARSPYRQHDQNPRTRETRYVKPLGLSIDLEVGVANRRIRQFAAVREADGTSFLFQKGNLDTALERLDKFAEGSASFSAIT